MKEIKIKFIGFWPDFDYNNNFFTEILSLYYKVIISDKPDYLFCSVLGTPYEECNYDCVRIHYNGENYTPDFNIHDYGISFNEMELGDRHFRYPLYLVYYDYLKPAQKKHIGIEKSIIEDKPYFCNYIYGVDRDYRIEAFETFSKYKKVYSPGIGNNNMPEHTLVRSQDDKVTFQKKCKFSIAFDSVCIPGFVTEKILHAYAAQTIPIYFGDPHVGLQFNKKSFIDVADYGYDLDKVIERIIEIDRNDDLFLEMLSEPAFINDNFIEVRQKEFENYLLKIFDQDLDKAYRRSRIAAPKLHDERLRFFNNVSKKNTFKVLKKYISILP